MDSSAAAPIPTPPPSKLEKRFAQKDFAIRVVKDAGSGVNDASKLRIEFPDGTTLSR